MFDNTEKIKPLLRLGILGGIVCCLFVSLSGTDGQNLAANNPAKLPQASVLVPIKARQRDPVNGVVPIYLKCQANVLIVPDVLEKIPCKIKNNSSKTIRAIVVGQAVTTDINGKTSSNLGYITIDSFLHSDLQTESSKKGIGPNAEPQLPSASETFEGLISRVEVFIDYAEFDDKQTLGPNRAGERIVLDMRDGAGKYKNWLSKEYETNGRSVAALVRLIEDTSPTVTDLGIRNSNEEQGAIGYRNWLRRLSKTKGVEEMRKTFQPHD